VEAGTERPEDHAALYRVTDEPAYLQTSDYEKPVIVAEPMPNLLDPRACSFCKQIAEHLFGEQYPETDNTGAIIDGVWICDACVARSARFLAQEQSGTTS
jgi:hypothetical protein